MNKQTEKKCTKKFEERERKSKNNNYGITLIALVITVIVLLILAGISISMLSGDNGILQKATTAKTNTDNAQIIEKIRLAYNSALTKDIVDQKGEVYKSTFEDELKTEFPGKTIDIGESANKKEWVVTIDGVTENVPIGEDKKIALKLSEHKNEKFDDNTKLEDDFGNKITVPAGFKITSDSPNSVIGGIVIEDVDAGTAETIGSQFVWIPVGDVYTDTNSSKTNIELCRCGFKENGEKVTVEEGYEYQLSLIQAAYNPPAEYINQMKTYTFIEETPFRKGSKENNINATAKELSMFISSVSSKGGYYIGRYEARATSEDATTVVTEKAGDPVYNYVTQVQASEYSRNMYSSNNNFESDLMNSYAWDTAILFLQAFDDRTDKSTKYSLQTSLNNSLSTTGTSADKICNIYDMASNCFEWTTETYSNTDTPCVFLGGCCDYNDHYTSYRSSGSTTDSSYTYSFRPILYVK